MKLRWLVIVTAGLLATLPSASLFSQSQGGTITGIVTDEAENFIPGVTVTAMESKTGERVTVVTVRSGTYTFPGLTPGSYVVSASLPGFESLASTVVLQGNEGRVNLDFKLKVAPQGRRIVQVPDVGTIPIPPARPQFKADSRARDGSVMRYRGNVEMITDAVVIHADEIDFDLTTEEAAVRGNVRVQVLPVELRPASR